MKIIEFEKQQHESQILELFDEFGDYLTSVDDHHRSIRGKGYAQHFYNKMLKDTSEKLGKILVAMEGEVVIGFIVGIVIELSGEDLITSKPGKIGRVTELYIKHGFRGQKLGGQLIKQIETYFKENHCYASKIDVFGPNTRALNFYQNHGYAPRSYDLAKFF